MEKKLLHLIEKCRAEMIELSEKQGLNSEEVIQSSKRLDDLLNQYHESAG